MDGSTRGLLIIMAKQPAAGMVKARLCPPLTPNAARQLYEAFLADTLALVEAACWLAGDMTPALAYAPATAAVHFRARTPTGFVLQQQQGAGLGARLANLPGQAQALGYGPVVMISSDSPTLPPAQVARGCALLRQPGVDGVLGPCADGGYYRIGLRAPQPALFTGIPWSTAAVTAATLAAAARAGLRLEMLPLWYDIDTAADLLTLQAEVAANPGAAPHTAAVLAELAGRLDAIGAGS